MERAGVATMVATLDNPLDIDLSMASSRFKDHFLFSPEEVVFKLPHKRMAWWQSWQLGPHSKPCLRAKIFALPCERSGLLM